VKNVGNLSCSFAYIHGAVMLTAEKHGGVWRVGQWLTPRYDVSTMSPAV
jgi:hypothetical protein